ncbi:MAG: hypothetical protein KF799_14105 [Bdellovibrionales bacterium]|nr:hypothetical protein [Bdellovibrionales bacterium]
MKCIFCLCLIAVGSATQAMPIQSQMLKPAAYMQATDDGLFEPLDLKAKTLTFKKTDFDQCGLNLLRQSSTMNYSCTLAIPTQARTSRLQNVVTAKQVEVDFGSSKRKVYVSVSEDARSITFMTGFDATGIDFEVSKFNDDFFKVYDKVALLVIAEAFSKQPVRLEVLENGESKKPAPNAKKQIKSVVKTN